MALTFMKTLYLEVDGNEPRINNHLIVDISSFILANECKRLCEKNKRVNNVKFHSKNKKWEENTNLKKQVTIHETVQWVSSIQITYE